jgi:hypothetical protein
VEKFFKMCLFEGKKLPLGGEEKLSVGEGAEEEREWGGEEKGSQLGVYYILK